MSARSERDKTHRAARRRLARMTFDSGHKCHWCGAEVACESSLRRNGILVRAMVAKLAIKRGDGVSLVCRATIDHIEPLTGDRRRDNRPDNIVVACWQCNHDRSKRPRKIPKGQCVQCGGECHRSRRRCLYCQFLHFPPVAVRFCWLGRLESRIAMARGLTETYNV